MAVVIKINRAPVLRLWAALVAERLGYEWEEALTLGRALASLNAYNKGVGIGPCKPTVEGERKPPRKPRSGETVQVDLLRRLVLIRRVPEGLRAEQRLADLSRERRVPFAGKVSTAISRCLKGHGTAGSVVS